jgi:hypothetical protein
MRFASRFTAFAVLLAAPFSLAYGAEEYGNSLDWVPADAAFYSASLNGGEQIEIIGNSNAWQKFKSIPSVAMIWQMAEAQINDPNGPAAIPLQMMQLPENQQLLQMLGDMFSGEVVFYGGPKTIDCIKLYSALNAANTYAKLEAGAAGAEARRDAQARHLLETLQENRELLKTPDLVAAFKLIDPAAAKTQLKRLEIIAGMGLQATPIGNRFKREKVGEDEYLTLTLDGSLAPWDSLPWDEVEEEPGEFKALRDALENMTLVVSLGVRGKYLLLSIDESTAGLAKLGSGPVLADVKEFQPLAKFKDRKLAALSYISEKLAERMGYSSADIEDMEEQLGGLLEVAGVEDDKLKDRIASDIEKFGDDVKKYLPKPGAAMSFTFMTPTGFEGYSYSWAENKNLDASRPLTLTNHVGGNPMLALVGRGKPDPAAYDLMIKWGQVAFSYFDEFAVPQMNADEREKFNQVMRIVNPLLMRADKATRELLLPATQDGQLGFVLDAKATSKRWHREMPASAHALPMAELAIVVGVNDTDKFKAAFREYRAIADELIEELRKLDPKGIPADFRIPDPQTKSTGASELYTYHLPKEAGLDRQIAPTGGIADGVAVAATTPALAERILSNAPLQGKGLLSSEAATPCGAVVYFHWPALVDAATPWIEFAIRENAPGAEGAGATKDPDEIAGLLSQVRIGLEILKCWRTSESVTTIADGVTVTHSRTVFEDVK